MVAPAVVYGAVAAVGLISGKRSSAKARRAAQAAADAQFKQTQEFNANVLAMQEAAAAQAAGMAAGMAAQQEGFNNQMIAFNKAAMEAQQKAADEARKRAEIANVRERKQSFRANRIAQGELEQNATTANAASSSSFSGASASLAQQYVSNVSFLERSQQTVNKEVGFNRTASAFMHKSDAVSFRARQGQMNYNISRDNFERRTAASLSGYAANFNALQQYNSNRLSAKLTGISNRNDFRQGAFSALNTAFSLY